MMLSNAPRATADGLEQNEGQIASWVKSTKVCPFRKFLGKIQQTKDQGRRLNRQMQTTVHSDAKNKSSNC